MILSGKKTGFQHNSIIPNFLKFQRVKCDEVELKGKVFALGTIDDVKAAFGENIKGAIERVPVAAKELTYEDGAIVSLMRDALTRSMAEATGLPTDGRHEIWKKETSRRKSKHGTVEYYAYDSIQLYLRRIGDIQYLVLKPSIKVMDVDGSEAPLEVANPVKLGILGYQHNGPFNNAVNEWRGILLPKGQELSFEFPRNCGSTFKFKVSRSPVFGEIGLPQGGKPIRLSDKDQKLVKHGGIQLGEPQLLFSNKQGTGLVSSPHPIRGIAENYPYDYALTARGFLAGLRLGVICPDIEGRRLRRYLPWRPPQLPPRVASQTPPRGSGGTGR